MQARESSSTDDVDQISSADDVDQSTLADAKDVKPHLIFNQDGTTFEVEEELVIGREQCGGDSRVSPKHFHVSKVADFYLIQDLSTAGTDMNGDQLPPKKRVSIREGDVVGLHAVPSMQFTFHDGSGKNKKQKLADSRSSQSDKMEETLFCSICRDVMYKPVSLLPCLHNFCSYCLGQCLKANAKHGKLECPMARCSITDLKRNALFESVVDTFLEQNPAKKRTAEEMKFADENDELLKANYKLQAFHIAESDGENEGDDGAESSSDILDYCGCCGMGINDLQNQCDACHTYLCSVLCKPVAPGVFLQNASIFDLNLPYRWLQNKVECKILDEIFNSRSVHISDAVPSVMSEETKNAACCRKCVLENIGDALYTYRQNVPADELPDEFRDRPHCWWGKNCRTQLGKEEHAKKLNHACEQTRRVN